MKVKKFHGIALILLWYREMQKTLHPNNSLIEIGYLDKYFTLIENSKRLI